MVHEPIAGTNLRIGVTKDVQIGGIAVLGLGGLPRVGGRDKPPTPSLTPLFDLNPAQRPAEGHFLTSHHTS